MTINIDYPLYNGSNPGKKCVGIAEWRILNEGAVTQFNILQTYKSGRMKGKRIYPYTYCIASSELAKYPVKVVSNNTRLRIVPIDDCYPKVFDKKESAYYFPKPKVEDSKPQIEQGKLL